jgi:thymidylate kinase
VSGGRLALAPPPGPLAWLHPELLALHPEDAAHEFGDALVERAARSSSVAIEDGPRGVALGRFLRERLRGRPIAIALDPERPSFERRLAGGSPATGAPSRDAPRLLPIDTSGDEAALIARLDAALADARRRDARAPPPIPIFLTRAPPPATHATGPVHTRLRESWFGLLPGDEYGDAVRSRWHALIRALHPDRFLRFLALENAALAGIDLYDEVVRDRAATLPTPRRVRARLFAVEGIDGAGKSTHVAALAEHLKARGLRVASHKLFRHGLFHETVTDLTRQCEGERNLHLWPLQRMVKVFDSLKCLVATVAPDLERCDALIFDRYAPTHLAEGLGRYHHDPFSRELLAALPALDRLFLLDLPAGEALARIEARASAPAQKARTIDENPYMLGRYRAALAGLARRDGQVVLDARAPFEVNQRRMREEVDRCLAEARA